MVQYHLENDKRAKKLKKLTLILVFIQKLPKLENWTKSRGTGTTKLIGIQQTRQNFEASILFWKVIQIFAKTLQESRSDVLILKNKITFSIRRLLRTLIWISSRKRLQSTNMLSMNCFRSRQFEIKASGFGRFWGLADTSSAQCGTRFFGILPISFIAFELGIVPLKASQIRHARPHMSEDHLHDFLRDDFSGGSYLSKPWLTFDGG